jgi:hypothetical protein
MEESILKMHDKTTLKNMALDRGLTSTGFNGRNRSRMRKQDFIDFIISVDHSEINSRNNGSFEDEMINMLQDIFMGDSLQHPVIRIMGNLGNLTSDNREQVGFLFARTNDNYDDDKQPERVPNEEDENVPNLKEIMGECGTLDCECDACTSVKLENLKVKENIINVETKITCVVCLTNSRNVIFNPCSHLATCITCSKNLIKNKCPLCRKTFESTTRVFF